MNFIASESYHSKVVFEKDINRVAVVTHQRKYCGDYKIKKTMGLATQGISAWERIAYLACKQPRLYT